MHVENMTIIEVRKFLLMLQKEYWFVHPTAVELCRRSIITLDKLINEGNINASDG